MSEPIYEYKQSDNGYLIEMRKIRVKTDKYFPEGIKYSLVVIDKKIIIKSTVNRALITIKPNPNNISSKIGAPIVSLNHCVVGVAVKRRA